MIYVLDDAKAKRLGGRTMTVPTVDEVRAAIQAIPSGETRTVLVLRSELAQAAGAEIACPRATTVAWFAVAAEDDAPWWRVTRDGKPEPRLPGGVEAHRARLDEEGVRLR